MKKSLFIQYKKIWLLYLILLCGAVSIAIFAAVIDNKFNVSFENYDGTGVQTVADVPLGTQLYSTIELQEKLGDAFTPVADSSFYLYYAGNGDVEAFGPLAIKDPHRSDKYDFKDWKKTDADKTLVIKKDTTFIARYTPKSRYVINAAFVNGEEDKKSLSETISSMYDEDDKFSIEIPEIQGMDMSLDDELNEFFTPSYSTGIIGYIEGTLDHNTLTKLSKYITTDANGNQIISLWFCYSFPKNTPYIIKYYQQTPEGEAYVEVAADAVSLTSDTQSVNIKELGYLKEYEHFNITEESAYEAQNCDISPKGDTVIKLYYNRDKYAVYYDSKGGTYYNPEVYFYGQEIVYIDEPEYPGHEFAGWDYAYTEDGVDYTDRPTTMPAGDVYLTANWDKRESNYRIVYWVENTDMTEEGQDAIYIDEGAYASATLPTGANLYEEFANGNLDSIIMNNFICDTSDYVNNVPDSRYFQIEKDYTLSHNDKELIVDGNGQTTLNVYIKRKEYKVRFVLAQISGTNYLVNDSQKSGAVASASWKLATTSKPQILDENQNDLTETVTISGTQYLTYTLKAKFGEDIYDKWPINVTGTSFGGWNIVINQTVNTISGIYGEFSDELIADPNNTDVILDAVIYGKQNVKPSEFYIMIDNMDPADTTGTYYAGTGKYYTVMKQYSSFAQPGAGKNGALFMDGYMLEEYTEKSPYYYYYTRELHKFNFYNVNASYYLKQYTTEQKQSLAKNGIIIADDGSVTVKHGANISVLKEESAKWAYDANNMLKYPLSTPGTKKDWTFAGWYQDAMGTVSISDELWNEKIIENITIYAKWEPPKYSLTYIIPNGYMRDEVIEAISERYNCTVTNEVDRQLVTIEDIPEGTTTTQFTDFPNDGKAPAVNDYGYEFVHWMHAVGSGKELEFLFSESNKVYNDIVITAKWKREPIGKYTVHYITKEDVSGLGYGSVVLDGVTYYQLLPEKNVGSLYYGQNINVTAEEILGYLPEQNRNSFILTKDMDVYFIYDKITADITYYVHYVLDTGIDYGTTVPLDSAVELIPPKKVVIDSASVKTSITETAEVISGYTPRDQWTGKLALSVNENNNHLYFYYNSNSQVEEYRIEYIFMDSEGNYGDGAQRYTCAGMGSIGQVLYGKSYAKDYAALLNDEESVKMLDEYMKGHVFDEDISDEYVLIDGETTPVLYVYMKKGTYTLTFDLNDSDSDNKAEWEAPVEFTDLGGGRYSRGIVYPDYIVEPVNKPTRAAFVFAGWSYYKEAAEPDKSIDIFRKGGLCQDTVLYAVWKTTSLIYIDSLVGTESNEFAVVEAQAPLPAEELLRSTPHDGYLFKGWYLDVECTIPYNPDNPPEDFLTNEKNYLYAGWRQLGTIATDDADEVLELCDGSSYTEINNTLPEFEMVGARIRTYEAAGIKQGEWFISRISESLVSDVENLNPMNVPLQPQTAKNKGKGYGTVVTLAQRIAQDSEFVKDEKAVSVSSGNFVSPATLTLLKCNGYKYYSCAVQGMPESYYEAPLLCRAYITYYDCNGNMYTYYYTESGEPYTAERMSGSYAGGYAISYWYTAKYMLDEGFYPEDSEDYEFLQSVYNVANK